MPLVSVIINCAFGARYLDEAIASVLAQTHRPLDIIFVDNQSTDGSAEIAHKYARDGHLRYFKTAEWLPLYGARNFGLDHAQGDHVAFIDCDDIWEPRMLEILLTRMRPGVDFVYGGRRYIDAEGLFLSKQMKPTPRANLVNALLFRNFISIGCVLVRNEVIRFLRFDPEYDLIGDFDLWTRLGTSGHVGDCVSDLLERTRIHGGNYSIAKRDKWLSEERRFYRRFLAEHRLRYPMIVAFIAKCELSRLLHRRKI